MQIVFIEDNSEKAFNQVFVGENHQQAFADIQHFANYSIKELLESNSNLLVFPHSLKEVRDQFDNSVICNLKGSVDKLEKTQLETFNIMGFIGCKGTELRIRSRFAKNDKNDYFLHYMLQKVFSINVMNLKVGKDDESVFDFLLYLFPHYLRKALSQGIYREYCQREYNDDRIRGSIDISRHIRSNIPFNGKIAYRTREYSCDNRVTQLIRHTIEYILTTPQSSILKNDLETRDCVSKICGVTQSYNQRNRYQVLSQNIKTIRNPYFSEYTILQKLCINILNHRKIKYGEKNNQVYGILFDGAWLWEEYLWTVLHKAGFEHPQNKLGTNRWYLFENHKYPRYPDFYNDSLILDAKYKRLAVVDDEDRLNRSVSRDDMHQMICYMHISDKERNGCFLFPDAENSMGETLCYEIGMLNGFGGKISLCGFPVPKVQDNLNYKSFVEKMKASEDSIVKKLSAYSPK